MKELYTSPEMEIISLNAEDVITGSGCECGVETAEQEIED